MIGPLARAAQAGSGYGLRFQALLAHGLLLAQAVLTLIYTALRFHDEQHPPVMERYVFLAGCQCLPGRHRPLIRAVTWWFQAHAEFPNCVASM